MRAALSYHASVTLTCLLVFVNLHRVLCHAHKYVSVMLACLSLLWSCPQVLLLSLLDLPFSISPVVTGLMLMLLYGRAGWFAQFLAENGINIVFAFPGKDCQSG